MTSLQALAATEHNADLQRAAAVHRRERVITVPAGQPGAAVPQAIDLRLARTEEDAVLRRLAILDEEPALEGPALLALVDGKPVAALSLRDGRVVADPFVPTREAVTLLRLRARHLSIAGQVRRRRLRLHTRWA